MSLPTVSVIIPNYNYAGYIGLAIDSVLAQTYPNIEVIVVDDGSRDNSIEVLQAYDGKIKLIEQCNQGVAVARNKGAEESSGEMLAFLDADDIWQPDKLQKQVHAIRADEGVGMVHCSMTYIDPAGDVVGEICEGMEGSVAVELLRFDRGVVIGIGSTGLVRRPIFDALGGFDPRMSTAADWDFSYRVACMSRIAFVREALVLYRVHSSNMHSNIGVMEHDMLLGFEKAFATEAGISPKECYANLYKTLAGSYYRTGNYHGFLRNSIKSLAARPANLGYFFRAGMRRFRSS